MVARTRWAFGSGLLAVTLIGGHVFTQQPIPTPQLPTPSSGIPSTAVDPLPLTPSAPALPAPVVPEPKSIEALVKQVKAIRQQKAELERQEQAALAELRERVKVQRTALAELGIGLEGGHPPAPATASIPSIDLPRSEPPPTIIPNPTK